MNGEDCAMQVFIGRDDVVVLCGEAFTSAMDWD